MKKLILLGIILLLVSQGTTAQLRNRDAFRRNLVLPLNRTSVLMSREQYRLRSDQLRLRAVREKILRDGRISPYEKKKLKKTHRYPRHRRIFKTHPPIS